MCLSVAIFILFPVQMKAELFLRFHTYISRKAKEIGIEIFINLL